MMFLLEIEEKTFSELLDEINPSKVLGFSTKGANSTYEKIAKDIPDDSCHCDWRISKRAFL